MLTIIMLVSTDSLDVWVHTSKWKKPLEPNFPLGIAAESQVINFWYGWLLGMKNGSVTTKSSESGFGRSGVSRRKQQPNQDGRSKRALAICLVGLGLESSTMSDFSTVTFLIWTCTKGNPPKEQVRFKRSLRKVTVPVFCQ